MVEVAKLSKFKIGILRYLAFRSAPVATYVLTNVLSSSGKGPALQIDTRYVRSLCRSLEAGGLIAEAPMFYARQLEWQITPYGLSALSEHKPGELA